jgi:hypothetical protein
LPTTKPERLLTQREVLARFQVSLPTYLKYERLSLVPRGRVICGRTMYLESEVEECMLNAPFRKLRGGVNRAGDRW